MLIPAKNQKRLKERKQKRIWILLSVPDERAIEK
jgi:hypothetical protein